jgi:PPM family protein phosphatase
MPESLQSTETRSKPTNGVPQSAGGIHPLTVQSFGLTDRGKEREANQDQFVTATLARALWIHQSSVQQSQVYYAKDRGYVFIVADGMGGVHGGGEASAIAVGAVEGVLLNALHWVISLSGSEDASVLRDFQATLQSADASVYAAGAGNPGLRGMGTTLTMAYSSGADLFVAHVGDSRCYLMRAGALQRLTRDDTLVQQLVETGLIPPEEVATNPFRHVITNVVGGTERGVRTEVHRLSLEAGDALLLCSDGLTGMVPDPQIAAVLTSTLDPKAACEELVALANAAGGTDNITVVVARYS